MPAAKDSLEVTAAQAVPDPMAAAVWVAATAAMAVMVASVEWAVRVGLVAREMYLVMEWH